MGESTLCGLTRAARSHGCQGVVWFCGGVLGTRTQLPPSPTPSKPFRKKFDHARVDTHLNNVEAHTFPCRTHGLVMCRVCNTSHVCVQGNNWHMIRSREAAGIPDDGTELLLESATHYNTHFARATAGSAACDPTIDRGRPHTNTSASLSTLTQLVPERSAATRKLRRSPVGAPSNTAQRRLVTTMDYKARLISTLE